MNGFFSRYDKGFPVSDFREIIGAPCFLFFFRCVGGGVLIFLFCLQDAPLPFFGESAVRSAFYFSFVVVGEAVGDGGGGRGQFFYLDGDGGTAVRLEVEARVRRMRKRAVGVKM